MMPSTTMQPRKRSWRRAEQAVRKLLGVCCICRLCCALCIARCDTSVGWVLHQMARQPLHESAFHASGKQTRAKMNGRRYLRRRQGVNIQRQLRDGARGSIVAPLEYVNVTQVEGSCLGDCNLRGRKWGKGQTRGTDKGCVSLCGVVWHTIIRMVRLGGVGEWCGVV